VLNNFMVPKLKSKKILTIEEIRECTRNINNQKISNCYLFGSYAKNRANLFSDIDILFIFDEVEYLNIQMMIKSYKTYFLEKGYICNPIYTHKKYLQDNSNILIRQYIKYGILMFGNTLNLSYESDEELKQKEYKDYWKANYLRKLNQLKTLFEHNNLEYGLLKWQYIYLIVYWYAKAELTLMDKQHSLNEYSLYYIYHNLLNIKLDTKQIYFLNLSNTYRDFYSKGTYIEDIENSQGYVDIMLKLIDKEEDLIL